jgi:hypothetical protein
MSSCASALHPTKPPCHTHLRHRENQCLVCSTSQVASRMHCYTKLPMHHCHLPKHKRFCANNSLKYYQNIEQGELRVAMLIIQETSPLQVPCLDLLREHVLIAQKHHWRGFHLTFANMDRLVYATGDKTGKL